MTAVFPAGLEPATFRVLGGRDNHYTTETTCFFQRKLPDSKDENDVFVVFIVAVVLFCIFYCLSCLFVCFFLCELRHPPSAILLNVLAFILNFVFYSIDHRKTISHFTSQWQYDQYSIRDKLHASFIQNLVS